MRVPLLLHDLNAAPELIGAVLALNAAHETETSPLTSDRLRAMLATSLHARAALHPDGGLAGFLIAFDPDAGYDSPNFLWLRDRLARFAYVDRIVVDPAARGRGVARALYADLFGHAAAGNLETAACEINVTPPNPASDAFHAALGFHEIGRAALPGGKTVRYLARPLAVL